MSSLSGLKTCIKTSVSGLKCLKLLTKDLPYCFQYFESPPVNIVVLVIICFLDIEKRNLR